VKGRASDVGGKSQSIEIELLESFSFPRTAWC
jgi:hypothetical protein